MIVSTERLVLIPCQPEHLQAFLRGKNVLGQMLRAEIPDSWPVFAESFTYWLPQLMADANLVGWANWMVLHQADQKLIGEGGFTGKPDESGTVEVGYAIIPEYRGQGYATEALQGWLQWAMTFPTVKHFQAHTLEEGLESQQVLIKNGFSRTERLKSDEGILYRWSKSVQSLVNSEGY